ncbi:MAG: YicC family protein [Ruminococcaceae bacterium]|nr:YicC family protein [Oscillospiraceae bacterium]
MIKSMTGYGRAQAIRDGLDITFEIKSVNHRYFDFSSRVPRSYAFLEEKLKAFVKEQVARGKIECYVHILEIEAQAADVVINAPLVEGYIRALNSLESEYGLRNDISVMQVGRMPEVLTVKKAEADEDAVWQAVMPVAQEAIDRFIAMRAKEGEKLKEDVLSRAAAILKNVSFIESQSEQTVKDYTARLSERIQEVLADTTIDEARILTEAAIFADKVAVAEETVRLRSHIAQLGDMLESEEAVGRKLDFLVQEMNREANTIGSKCQDVNVTKKVLDIKSEIEKIREQIQNIE